MDNKGKTAFFRRPAAQLLVALAAVVLDRLMKIWISANIPGEMVSGSWVRLGEDVPLIPGVIHLTNEANTGAAFSIFRDMPWLLLAASIVLMAFVVWMLFSGKVRNMAGLFAMGLVLGGAVGNAIDRAFFGYVVDMFEVEFMNYAIFNVADIFIVCGAILFCVYILFFEGKKGEVRESFRVVPREEYEEQTKDDNDKDKR